MDMKKELENNEVYNGVEKDNINGDVFCETKQMQNIDQNLVLDKNVEEIKKETTKKSKWKKTIVYTIFILINVIAILAVLLLENKSGDMATGKKAMNLLGENYIYTVCVFIMFLLQMASDTTTFYFLTRQAGMKKNIMLSLKTSVIGKYYEKLTPWTTGGQPAQMAYLSMKGFDAPTGCSIPLAKSIIRVFIVGFVVLVIFIVSAFTNLEINIYVMIAAFVSIFGSLIVPVFLIVFIKHPKLGQKMTKWIINLLYKMKIVKDFEKQYQKFSIMVDNFLKGIGYLSSHKKMILLVGLTCIIELFSINAMPFFIIRAFGISNIGFWHTITLCLYVNYASLFAPSPGAAGAAELSFYAIFASVITGSYLFWAILFWRIMSYYLPMFNGIILQINDGIKSIIKNKKSAKKS